MMKMRLNWVVKEMIRYFRYVALMEWGDMKATKGRSLPGAFVRLFRLPGFLVWIVFGYLDNLIATIARWVDRKMGVWNGSIIRRDRS